MTSLCRTVSGSGAGNWGKRAIRQVLIAGQPSFGTSVCSDSIAGNTPVHAGYPDVFKCAQNDLPVPAIIVKIV